MPTLSSADNNNYEAAKHFMALKAGGRTKIYLTNDKLEHCLDFIDNIRTRYPGPMLVKAVHVVYYIGCLLRHVLLPGDAEFIVAHDGTTTDSSVTATTLMRTCRNTVLG